MSQQLAVKVASLEVQIEKHEHELIELRALIARQVESIEAFIKSAGRHSEPIPIPPYPNTLKRLGLPEPEASDVGTD